MAEPTTFVKLDRNLLRWRWYKDANTMRTFLHLLLLANYDEHDFRGLTIHRGEAVISYQSLADALGISIKSARTALEHLKRTGEVASKAYSKFQVVTLINYDEYQGYGQSIRQPNGKQAAGKGRPNGNTKRNKETKEDEEVYISIVSFLNERAGTNYRASTEKTLSLINARLAEGFTVEDFKIVIENKCNDWLGTEYEKYLRPETLFGNKFESYLNSRTKQHSQPSGNLDFLKRWEV